LGQPSDTKPILGALFLLTLDFKEFFTLTFQYGARRLQNGPLRDTPIVHFTYMRERQYFPMDNIEDV
jgi:hypothetical protein